MERNIIFKRNETKRTKFGRKWEFADKIARFHGLLFAITLRIRMAFVFHRFLLFCQLFTMNRLQIGQYIGKTNGHYTIQLQKYALFHFSDP